MLHPAVRVSPQEEDLDLDLGLDLGLDLDLGLGLVFSSTHHAPVQHQQPHAAPAWRLQHPQRVVHAPAAAVSRRTGRWSGAQVAGLGDVVRHVFADLLVGLPWHVVGLVGPGAGVGGCPGCAGRYWRLCCGSGCRGRAWQAWQTAARASGRRLRWALYRCSCLGLVRAAWEGSVVAAWAGSTCA